jgi:hypothetical protein
MTSQQATELLQLGHQIHLLLYIMLACLGLLIGISLAK